VDTDSSSLGGEAARFHLAFGAGGPEEKNEAFWKTFFRILGYKVARRISSFHGDCEKLGSPGCSIIGKLSMIESLPDPSADPSARRPRSAV